MTDGAGLNNQQMERLIRKGPQGAFERAFVAADKNVFYTPV